MAAYVARVLQSKEAFEKANLDALLSNLSRQIDEQKASLKEKLDPRYQTFQQCYRYSEDLSARLTSAVPEVEAVEEEVRDHVMPRLHQAAYDIRELSKELKTVEEQCAEVTKYVHIHKCFEKADEAFSTEDFEECSRHLENAVSVIRTLLGKPDVSMVEAIQCEQVVMSERLRYKLSEVWKQHIAWNVGKTPHVVVLTLQTVNSLPCKALLRALKGQNELKDKVTQFARSFLANIVEPMVKYGSKVTVEPGLSTLQVDFVENQVPAISDVLGNLSQVFTFLKETLADLSVDGKTLLQMVGQIVGCEFADIVIKYCLEPAIPSEGSQLVEFPSDVLLNLHSQLLEMQFLSSEMSQFSSFTMSLESLSINKRNRNILLKARETMKLPLYDTVTVGQVRTAEKQRPASPNYILDGSIFRFPKAQVSTSVVEIVDLMKPIVNEALEFQAQQSWHIEAVRNICELYCGVVPVIHQHAIVNIPQQTAIHHNNCMYLAHSLLELGACTPGVAVVDLVSKLRQLGVTSLLDQMQKQMKHLMEFLHEVPTYDDGRSIERAMQRCLFQLQQLKGVWSSVLPEPVYLNTIGTLLNSVLDHIIANIISMEDISAMLSEDLMAIFDRVITQATKLFDVPDSSQDERAAAAQHVQKWKKFCELKCLLGFNLREVMDRWADGKGLLAIYFTPEEVKKLIRALFQNTDRRAAALAKIR